MTALIPRHGGIGAAVALLRVAALRGMVSNPPKIGWRPRLDGRRVRLVADFKTFCATISFRPMNPRISVIVEWDNVHLRSSRVLAERSLRCLAAELSMIDQTFEVLVL
jgi:hypothetical protein